MIKIWSRNAKGLYIATDLHKIAIMALVLQLHVLEWFGIIIYYTALIMKHTLRLTLLVALFVAVSRGGKAVPPPAICRCLAPSKVSATASGAGLVVVARDGCRAVACWRRLQVAAVDAANFRAGCVSIWLTKAVQAIN